MDPKWTLSLLAAILHTVASAPESVFAREGNSVTLNMQRQNNLDTDDAIWVFNQSCDVVRYYPHHDKLHQLIITETYKGRVEFDCATFSLELTNPQKNDSGLYKGEINADGRKAVSEYRLNVLEQVTVPILIVESVSSSGDLCHVTVTCRAGDLSLTSTCDISTCTQEEQTVPSSLAIFIKDDVIICNHSNPVSWHHATVELEALCQSTPQLVAAPVLTVEPVSSSGDLCHVTVTCRAGDLSLTSTCDISTCTQEEQTVPSSLAISIKDDVITCNHSNPVSWHHATVELEMLCQKPEFPLGDERTLIWIYATVASGLVLLVLVLGCVLCSRMHSKNQAGCCPKVYQSVMGIVPTEMTPEKKQSEVSAKTLSPSSDVRRRTPKSRTQPSYSVVNFPQTLSPAVKRQTHSKDGFPSSYAVENLLQKF